MKAVIASLCLMFLGLSGCISRSYFQIRLAEERLKAAKEREDAFLWREVKRQDIQIADLTRQLKFFRGTK